jgi:hypothetical protein
MTADSTSSTDKNESLISGQQQEVLLVTHYIEVIDGSI